MASAIIAQTRNGFNASSLLRMRLPYGPEITRTRIRFFVSNTLFLSFTVALIVLYAAGLGQAQSDPPPSELPLLHLSDFRYEGAFRVPGGTFGTSSMDYAQGPIEYNSVNHSMFMVGHAWQQEIAEFSIPELVNSGILEDLNTAGTPLQNFSATVLDRVSGGNPQDINRIKGMEYVTGPKGPELLVNGQEYYDAPADNTHTTLVVRNANTIENSPVDGYFSFPGGAHASGWISPIPPAWQSILGGTHITGNSSGTPIISRLSVGPSAFVFNAFDIVGNSSVADPVPTTTLLDFSVTNPLHDDLENVLLTNDLWTHLSEAVYGFIVPGTRTYMTLGHSGGHNSGVCYKCTPSGGESCGGYCAYDSDDYYHYYWLWDVNDLVAVENGQMSPFNPRPYEYGKLLLPFHTRSLGGATFDPLSGLLYIAILQADNAKPVIVAYKVNIGNRGDPPMAQDDAFTVVTTAVGAPLAVLLDNGNGPDLDPNPGDVLTIASVDTTVTQGSAVINNNGTPGDPTDDVIAYTPAPGFSGFDYFSYSIEDSSGLRDTATVTITVTDGLVVNGKTYAVQSYGSSQDETPTAFRIEDNGLTLHLTGNTWKSVALSPAYGVTADTVLEFDFMSDGAEAEINGIGLDSQSQSINEALSFALAGSQTWGIRDFYGYGGGWQHYVIPIGQYMPPGERAYLFFINDADAGQDTSVRFRNTQIYEDSSIVNVPDVVGLAQDTAEADIVAAELTVGAITTQPSDTVPTGNVINQNPVAGSSVATGSIVDCVVSSGPVMLDVPDVVGLAQDTAEADIVAAELTVGAITTQPSDTVPTGNIISQNPAAGTSVTIGSTVDCVVSTGDIVTIKKTDYRSKPSNLQVEANSTDETAILNVYATFANTPEQFIGSIKAGGGKLTAKVFPAPVSVRVDSTKGGSATQNVQSW